MQPGPSKWVHDCCSFRQSKSRRWHIMCFQIYLSHRSSYSDYRASGQEHSIARAGPCIGIVEAAASARCRHILAHQDTADELAWFDFKRPSQLSHESKASVTVTV